MKQRFGALDIVAFITGFALMAYELAAARILAPSIGSSTYIWTSIIGVIIAALSLGYYIGGKLADKRHKVVDVAFLCIIAAALVGLTLLLYRDVLVSVTDSLNDPRWQGVVAALVLFAPTSFVLGIISPYLVKLKIQSLKTSGQSVASLSTLNSIGGIAGTFITGFVLFGYVGSIDTLKVIIVLLLGTSWLIAPRQLMIERIVATVALLAFSAFFPLGSSTTTMIDTPNAHYEVIKGVYNDRPVHGLTTGPGGVQSAVYTDGSDDLVFWYTQEIARLTLDLQPERIVVLGGGAFTLPQYLAEKLPSSQIDAVEIDPQLEPIAKQYFNYHSPSNVKLIFEDARTYVNGAHTAYDMVIMDAYGDTEMPFSLTTQEYVAALSRLVAPDGVVLVNAIGGLNGGACETIIRALHTSYQRVFPHALYSNESGTKILRANHILAYSRQPLSLTGMQPLDISTGMVLTDNYAPTERLHFSCVNS